MRVSVWMRNEGGRINEFTWKDKKGTVFKIHLFIYSVCTASSALIAVFTVPGFVVIKVLAPPPPSLLAPAATRPQLSINPDNICVCQKHLLAASFKGLQLHLWQTAKAAQVLKAPPARVNVWSAAFAAGL